MKQVRMSVLIFLTLYFSCARVHAQAQSSSALDPKTKAFLIICGYGTVGGALLGLASMAFGQESRSIAQGASIGLYAGILFGAYVIYTHNQDACPVSEDPSDTMPYEDSFVPYNDTTTSLSPAAIPYWHASSWAKLQETSSFAKEPSVSWTWNF